MLFCGYTIVRERGITKRGNGRKGALSKGKYNRKEKFLGCLMVVPSILKVLFFHFSLFEIRVHPATDDGTWWFRGPSPSHCLLLVGL